MFADMDKKAYSLVLDGFNMKKLGVYVTSRSSEPAPKKRYNEYSVAGRDGTLYEDTGFYEDKQKTVELNFYAKNPDRFNQIFREASEKIMNASIFEMTDDKHYFRKIKKVEIDDCEHVTKRVGKFTVTFTLDPYFYANDGDLWHEETSIYNKYNKPSCPVYEIEVASNAALTVNGNEITIEGINGTVTIDTARMICTDADGNEISNLMTGKYSNLLLQPGNNEISCDGTLRYKPMWRCI